MKRDKPTRVRLRSMKWESFQDPILQQSPEEEIICTLEQKRQLHAPRKQHGGKRKKKKH